jgi:hypothetical protein
MTLPAPDRSKWRIHPAPVITFIDLGPRGWARLHELAVRRGRSDTEQVLALVRWALHRSLGGEGVELTDEQLDDLLADDSNARAAAVAL